MQPPIPPPDRPSTFPLVFGALLLLLTILFALFVRSWLTAALGTGGLVALVVLFPLVQRSDLLDHIKAEFSTGKLLISAKTKAVTHDKPSQDQG